MNTPNNAAALERIFDAIDRVEALCAKSNKLDRERLLGRVMVNCADELSTLRAALLPREGMTNIVIGATRHYGGEAWFRELTVAGVTFLAPLDEQEKARGILYALTSQPSGEAVAARLTVYADTKAITARIHDVAHSLAPGTYDLYTHPSADAPGVAVDEWLPIESAPRDGTAILAYWNPLPNWPYPNDGSNFAVTAFRDGQWRPAGDDDDTEWDTPPLWRPLPAPPAALAPKPEGKTHE